MGQSADQQSLKGNVVQGRKSGVAVDRSKQDYSKALFVGGRASDDLKSSDLKGILIGLLLNPR